MIGRLLESRRAKKVVRRAADWVDLQFWTLIESLREVAPLASGTMLDVGCGDKPYEQFFTPYVSKYIGVEHVTTYANTNAGTRGRADVLYEGDRLPFDDASIDTVLCAQVLEHTPEPQKLLTEIARTMRPGAVAILSAPFSFRLHEEPHDYFRFSPHAWKTMCDAAGLEIERLIPHGGFWTLMAHKMNSFLALRVVGIEGFAQSLGKHGHEASAERRGIPWGFLFAAPVMVALSGAARVGDSVLDDPTDTLGFTVVARRRG